MEGGDFDGGWVGKKTRRRKRLEKSANLEPGKLRGVRDWKSKNCLKTWNLEN